MPIFIIRHPVNINAWLRIKNGVPHWITNAVEAEKFSSKYAARRFLKLYNNISKDCKIELLGNIK